MIVTFCGHSKFQRTKACKQKILLFLEEKVGDGIADIYLGGYGGFDEFAYECCKEYKEAHPEVSLVLVTPYLTVECQRNVLALQRKKYDHILYPGLENKPLRFAILYRNRYMVDKADYIVAYVTHSWGGAYQTLRYAEKKNKMIFRVDN